MSLRYFSCKCKNDIAGDLNNTGAGTLTHQLFSAPDNCTGSVLRKGRVQSLVLPRTRVFVQLLRIRGDHRRAAPVRHSQTVAFPCEGGRHSPFVGHHRDHKYKILYLKIFGHHTHRHTRVLRPGFPHSVSVLCFVNPFIADNLSFLMLFASTRTP